MSEDKDDQVNRILRGNTDHNPKPDYAARRNAAPRGVGAPSLTPGGSGSSQARPQRPGRDDQPNAPRPPTAPPNRDGAARGFRRLGDPKPAPGQDRAPENAHGFLGLGRSGVVRDFKDRSR